MDAQRSLGGLYLRGERALRRTPFEAVRLLRLAAAQGSAMAAHMLKKLAGERANVSACCAGCGARHKLKTCARCKVARFCTPECVKKAWAEHKSHCACWAAEAAEEV